MLLLHWSGGFSGKQTFGGVESIISKGPDVSGVHDVHPTTGDLPTVTSKRPKKKVWTRSSECEDENEVFVREFLIYPMAHALARGFLRSRGARREYEL